MAQLANTLVHIFLELHKISRKGEGEKQNGSLDPFLTFFNKFNLILASVIILAIAVLVTLMLVVHDICKRRYVGYYYYNIKHNSLSILGNWSSKNVVDQNHSSRLLLEDMTMTLTIEYPVWTLDQSHWNFHLSFSVQLILKIMDSLKKPRVIIP